MIYRTVPVQYTDPRSLPQGYSHKNKFSLDYSMSAHNRISSPTIPNNGNTTNFFYQVWIHTDARVKHYHDKYSYSSSNFMTSGIIFIV